MKKWSERESYYRGEKKKKKKKPNMHLQMLPFCDFYRKKPEPKNSVTVIFFKILLEKKQEEVEKPFHLAVSDG